MKTRFAALLLLALLVAPPAASAHANFVASEPPQGARLGTVPLEVRVTLSQDVDPAGSSLHVVDANGQRVDNDDLAVESGSEPVLAVTMRPGTPEGAYRVEWKVLSLVDHHTTQGSFGFAVGNFTPPSVVDASTNTPRLPSLLGRAAFFVGFFLAVAGIAFSLFIARSSVDGFLREVEVAAWPLIVAGSVILLGDAVSRTGLSPAEWTDSAVLRDLLVRVGVATALAITSVVLRGATRVRLGVLSFGVMVLAYYSSRSGHASSAGLPWILVDVVHLVATGTWVGGLLLFAIILLAPRRILVDDDALRTIGSRFSTTALVAVLTMAATGALLGVAILGLPELARPFAGFRGVYGAALLGKILLAVVMVALACVNRYAFLGRLLQPAPVNAVRARFGRFVSAEASVGVVVLLLAAVLTSTSPPYDSVGDGVVVRTAQSDTFRATMRIASGPFPGGFSDLEFQIVWLEDGSILQNDTCGRPNGCILLEVVAPGAAEEDEDESDVHHGGEHRILEPRGDGWWSVPDVLFVSEGEYGFLVEIQTEYVFFDVVELRLQVGAGEGEGGHEGHTGSNEPGATTRAT